MMWEYPRLALWSGLRVVAEPGGAAAFAALISGRLLDRPACQLPDPTDNYLDGTSLRW